MATVNLKNEVFRPDICSIRGQLHSTVSVGINGLEESKKILQTGDLSLESPSLTNF